MTRKNLLIILLILLKIITNSSDSLDFKNSNLSCGKKPTDSTKCSKYGTDFKIYILNIWLINKINKVLILI